VLQTMFFFLTSASNNVNVTSLGTKQPPVVSLFISTYIYKYKHAFVTEPLTKHGMFGEYSVCIDLCPMLTYILFSD